MLRTHGWACTRQLRLAGRLRKKDVDARAGRGHDGGEVIRSNRNALYRKLCVGCPSSSGARLLRHRAGVGSWNEDLDPAVLGASFGSLVVADRRGLALAVGLEAVWLGQEWPEQSCDAFGALDGQMVVVREADVAATDRRGVGVSDDFYEALFPVERAGDAARDRLELVAHRRRG